MVGAWVAATLAAAAVALAVVGLAGEQVADVVIQPLSAQDVEALGVSLPAATSTAATTPTTVADPVVTGATTTVPSDTTSTVPPTTSAASATTPTTAPPETARIDSRQITGGTVVVRWTASWVEFVSATPTDGFHVEVEERGPDQVAVEFEGNGVKSQYEAEVSDGKLVVETAVEPDED
jgi:hypothetical protein